MCGINGIVGFPGREDVVVKMNDNIKHRGPDAHGVWRDNSVILGHRRLSIIDLSANANQPFLKDGLVIVYNGEIYNFGEIKKELAGRGVNFRTNSDTEVVLELFRIYRQDCFVKLIGMFALCIYDIAKQELFLARDYFGIKPLYYSRIDKGKFVFSSELKSLLSIPGFKKEINPKAMVSCVNYLWIHGNQTIFKGVHKLASGHYLCLKVAKDEFTINQYWSLTPGRSDLKEGAVKNKLKELMEQSVRRHLVSDVPVGVFLSGGLDSSLIAVLAKKFNPDISAYTVSFGAKEKGVEQMPQDSIYAKLVADAFKIKHTDIHISADIKEALNNIIYFLDEPLADPAAINTYLMCNSAREHGIKVLLSGMGADEIFAGYRRHLAVLSAMKINKFPEPIKKLTGSLINMLPVRIGNHGIRQVRWAKRFLAFMGMSLDEAYMRSYSYYDKEELYKLFRYQFNAEVDELYSEHKDIFNKVKTLDDINKMCYTDINMFMTGLNLTYTDRASMASSVEVRVPFIDKELVEFAMSIKGEYKIRGAVSKYILKDVASNYLPKRIVHRPKVSFGMPIRAWVSDELRDYIDDVLSFENIKKRGIFDPQYVRQIIREDRQGKADNAYRIYQFLTLELWFRRYIDHETITAKF